MYTIPQICWYWLCAKLHCTITTSTTSELAHFLLSLLCVLIFSCYQIIFMVSGICNSSLHLSFIWNTSLLLILVIWIWIREFENNVSCFLWCSWYNREYLKLNKNNQVIQTDHSTLELSIWVCCLWTVFLYFSMCDI